MKAMIVPTRPSAPGRDTAMCHRVTVAVPVYNSEGTLPHTMESILAQTYTNLEIVICDNASTDRTTELCREWAAKDPRVRYYRNQANIGQTRNFRKALELSSGEFFMWTCADDCRPPEAIERLVEALVSNPKAVMAHGPIIARGIDFEVEIANAMDLSSPSPAERVRSFIRGIRHNSMVHGLYRRASLKKLVFGAHYGQDYLFSLQVCVMGPVQHVPQAMIVYHEKGVRPSEPMPRRPITLLEFLKSRGTNRKCLTVLLTGSRYVLTCREVALSQRVATALAYLSTFGAMYRRRLVMDAVSTFLRPLFGPRPWPGS